MLAGPFFLLVGLELDQEGAGDSVFAVAKVRTPARYNGARRSGVSARRRYSSGSREVRHVRRAMVIFKPIGEVLARHIVRRERSVPRLERITGILREIRCARSRCRSIDGRKQDQVTAWVVDASSAHCYAETIAIEPEAGVDHQAEEALLRGPLGVAAAPDAPAALATCVASDRERSFADEGEWPIVVLVLDAVVGVEACAARHT